MSFVLDLLRLVAFYFLLTCLVLCALVLACLLLLCHDFSCLACSDLALSCVLYFFLALFNRWFLDFSYILFALSADV